MTDALEVPGRSWSGTVNYGPGPLHAPTTVAELRALVGRSPRIRALGTRHSFSQVAASDGPLVTLSKMPADLDFDTPARTARVAAGVRYGSWRSRRPSTAWRCRTWAPSPTSRWVGRARPAPTARGWSPFAGFRGAGDRAGHCRR
ncbi:hypothetical protein [Brachybacterium sp. Z12]|uniref:hypothetical protein n=1 Tax=Brachybacterium sp. Z12 TaxID=2759167 RepID=UPI00223AF3AE|nr:hypothetical protein [Brachybacterium sp. Z12]